VCPCDGRYTLIAGWHRLAAAEKLGWKKIRAEIREGLDADAAELAEIDENLIRAELSPAERALHFGKRKRLYEKVHPETRHGAVGRRGKSSQDENSFVDDAAAKAGKGRSTVARDVTRANNIVVLSEIIGTSLDQGDELDALAKLPEADQRRLAEQAQANENVSAKQQEGGADPPTKCGIRTGVAMSPRAERGDDFYRTPECAVHALLKVESFNGPIWECACGDGLIVNALREAGHKVVATNLIDYGCPDSTSGVDFLKEHRAPAGVETIITNPPFMHADKFVRHALKLVPRVVMLLRLLFLESQGRCDIIDGGRLRRVYPFIDRLPEMHRNGWDGPRIENSPIQFAWFCWDRNYSGDIVVRRIWAREKGQPLATPIPNMAGAEPPPEANSFEPPIIAADDLGIPEFLRRERAV
jgi:hypothetical protein